MVRCLFGDAVASTCIHVLVPSAIHAKMLTVYGVVLQSPRSHEPEPLC